MTATEAKPLTLPKGTVTFLFTDMVGSSRMWERHGDGFIPVWQAHDAILRDAFARFGGYEVKTEGDAFMIAFQHARDALNCALFVQAALTRYPWPEDIGQPRVRIGLHTGEPFLHGNDYFGPVVNRAAHICASAHGGQVFVSDATVAAVGNGLDPGATLHDLGDHRLKDLGTPQRLFLAAHPSALPPPSPPPHTLDAQPNNLPVQRTSFLGRTEEIERIAAFLAQGEKPVLTLTGPGGIGKTRLSLQAAAARADWFPDGVWYVPLINAKDIVGAAVEIAQAMRIPLDPRKPVLEQVQAWLAGRHCLLILDDANTIPQAEGLIRELLSGSDRLRCLATSRESLQVAEGEEIELSGLSTDSAPSKLRHGDTYVGAMEPAISLTAHAPEEAAPIAATEAGRLFLERAGMVNPEFRLTRKEADAVQQLLEKFQGHPEMIERAANLMDRVLPSNLLGWLNSRLNVETSTGSTGADRLRDIVRRNAQKVRDTVEETARAASTGVNAGLNSVLQGIANVATDRREERAQELGRQTLRLSIEAGDAVGVAASLRQLARLQWQRGDRQQALSLLFVAASLYREQGLAEALEVQRELERLREEAERAGLSSGPVTLENAVALALGDNT